MDSQLIREYRERYQAVEVIELTERRAADMSLRWKQINATLQMALDLGLQVRDTEMGEPEAWPRWAKLKEAHK
jgi:hypothetical protein